MAQVAIPDPGGVYYAEDGTASIVLPDSHDPSFEPSEAEILDYARWLGMEQHEHADLLWIARDGLRAPLPENWRPCKTESDEVYYFNFATGESLWDHPLDEHFKQVLQDERKRLAEKENTPEPGSSDITKAVGTRGLRGLKALIPRSGKSSMAPSSELSPGTGKQDLPAVKEVNVKIAPLKQMKKNADPVELDGKKVASKISKKLDKLREPASLKDSIKSDKEELSPPAGKELSDEHIRQKERLKERKALSLKKVEQEFAIEHQKRENALKAELEKAECQRRADLASAHGAINERKKEAEASAEAEAAESLKTFKAEQKRQLDELQATFEDEIRKLKEVHQREHSQMHAGLLQETQGRIKLLEEEQSFLLSLCSNYFETSGQIFFENALEIQLLFSEHCQKCSAEAFAQYREAVANSNSEEMRKLKLQAEQDISSWRSQQEISYASERDDLENCHRRALAELAETLETKFIKDKSTLEQEQSTKLQTLRDQLHHQYDEALEAYKSTQKERLEQVRIEEEQKMTDEIREHRLNHERILLAKNQEIGSQELKKELEMELANLRRQKSAELRQQLEELTASNEVMIQEKQSFLREETERRISEMRKRYDEEINASQASRKLKNETRLAEEALRFEMELAELQGNFRRRLETERNEQANRISACLTAELAAVQKQNRELVQADLVQCEFEGRESLEFFERQARQLLAGCHMWEEEVLSDRQSRRQAEDADNAAHLKAVAARKTLQEDELRRLTEAHNERMVTLTTLQEEKLQAVLKKKDEDEATARTSLEIQRDNKLQILIVAEEYQRTITALREEQARETIAIDLRWALRHLSEPNSAQTRPANSEPPAAFQRFDDFVTQWAAMAEEHRRSSCDVLERAKEDVACAAGNSTAPGPDSLAATAALRQEFRDVSSEWMAQLQEDRGRFIEQHENLLQAQRSAWRSELERFSEQQQDQVRLVQMAISELRNKVQQQQPQPQQSQTTPPEPPQPSASGKESSALPPTRSSLVQPSKHAAPKSYEEPSNRGKRRNSVPFSEISSFWDTRSANSGGAAFQAFLNWRPPRRSVPSGRGAGAGRWDRTRLSDESDRISKARGFLKEQRKDLRSRQRALEDIRRDWKQDMRAYKMAEEAEERAGQKAVLERVHRVLERQATALNHDALLLQDAELWLKLRKRKIRLLLAHLDLPELSDELDLLNLDETASSVRSVPSPAPRRYARGTGSRSERPREEHPTGKRFGVGFAEQKHSPRPPLCDPAASALAQALAARGTDAGQLAHILMTIDTKVEALTAQLEQLARRSSLGSVPSERRNKQLGPVGGSRAMHRPAAAPSSSAPPPPPPPPPPPQQQQQPQQELHRRQAQQTLHQKWDEVLQNTAGTATEDFRDPCMVQFGNKFFAWLDETTQNVRASQNCRDG
eukprot:NODE_16_length_4662_cov_11.604379_g13_i0.p1 GENE.NODE_16_length_4662_cov_11.604379_g13_i0~~NODE_16_length_4662_cov_11.604379_g13_i0.p1  ORF type:complete len:1409 (-),score=337.43 NODE_16_length_4662_cov_11.604379_g13_i0:361-4587(-)